MTSQDKGLEFAQCIYCNLIVTVHRIWNIAYPGERIEERALRVK